MCQIPVREKSQITIRECPIIQWKISGVVQQRNMLPLLNWDIPMRVIGARGGRAFPGRQTVIPGEWIILQKRISNIEIE
jgi:hypothetical protein